MLQGRQELEGRRKERRRKKKGDVLMLESRCWSMSHEPCIQSPLPLIKNFAALERSE